MLIPTININAFLSFLICVIISINWLLNQNKEVEILEVDDSGIQQESFVTQLHTHTNDTAIHMYCNSDN